jgi:hypothetical protein
MERPFLAKLKAAIDGEILMADIDEIKRVADENVRADPFEKMISLAVIEAIDANTAALVTIVGPAIVEAVDDQTEAILESMRAE